jgi:hypothetical protein
VDNPIQKVCHLRVVTVRANCTLRRVVEVDESEGVVVSCLIPIRHLAKEIFFCFNQRGTKNLCLFLTSQMNAK